MSLWLCLVGILVALALPAHAEEAADPYLRLEDVTGDQALAWVREQNEQSTRELTTPAAFAALNERLLKILDSEEKIPLIEKAGDHYYNFWKDARHSRGIWRRTTLEEYAKPHPAWEVVLDLDSLGAAEKENWVWKGSTFLRPSCKRCLLFLSRGITFWTNELFLRRDGELIRIEKPEDAEVDTYRDLLFIQLRTAWTVGGQTYPAGALLATELEPFLKGKREFAVLFAPTERTSLAGYSPTRHHILLNELDNVRNRLYVLTRKGKTWRREELPGVPQPSSVNAWAVDSDESDDYFVYLSDYVTPPTLSLGTLGKGIAKKLKEGPTFFNAAGLTVSQHEAVSRDGTRVPYFQVSPKGLALEGNNPTLLYGYGGFEVSLTPGYSGTAGAAWMERGGVYVVANIRGGGEFGPQWHQAALKANRPRAYEDFIAVAEDLIRRKVTSPAHLGIMGGSNGGLLMGNMLTMRPDLFGAIVCQVPLLDMQRYHKLLAGASWMAEFGNPDDPKEWEFIRTFSPYQNVKKDVKYPRTLFLTSTRDDRVHPAHARKMVAKMKAMGHDVLYYENIEGGHGGAADNKQAAFMAALAYTFLWNQLQ